MIRRDGGVGSQATSAAKAGKVFDTAADRGARVSELRSLTASLIERLERRLARMAVLAKPAPLGGKGGKASAAAAAAPVAVEAASAVDDEEDPLEGDGAEGLDALVSDGAVVAAPVQADASGDGEAAGDEDVLDGASGRKKEKGGFTAAERTMAEVSGKLHPFPSFLRFSTRLCVLG